MSSAGKLSPGRAAIAAILVYMILKALIHGTQLGNGSIEAHKRILYTAGLAINKLHLHRNFRRLNQRARQRLSRITCHLIP
jgi:hydrogenase/urease accessory protein HupE